MIVDSCVNQRAGENSPLSYLDSIGVSPDAVKIIVATHAHDDHIAGISNIVAQCPEAEFVSSAAATREEFASVLELDEVLSNFVRPSSYSEYRCIYEIHLARRAADGRAGKRRHTKAQANLPIYRRRAENGSGIEASFTALSPSQEALLRAGESLAKLIPTAGSSGQPLRTRLPAEDPNLYAVALWVVVGDVAMLLGADLLRGPGPGCGWNAILSSEMRPEGHAEVFKIPHHGAPNAHHDGVWKEMAKENVLALLAPYRAGKHPRPDDADVRRLCDLTDSVYITASNRTPAPPKNVRIASQSLAALARNVRESEGLPGHVRARRRLSEADWTVDLAGNATRLR
jgi:hypothetical protein